MEIDAKDKDGVTIITITGNLDSTTSAQAQDKIYSMIKPGTKLVLDMSGCKYVSSAGLRVLLIIAKKIKRDGARAAITGIIDEVRDVMEMTGFDDMFDNYDSLDEAIASVR